MPKPTQTYLATLISDEATARRVADAIGEAFDHSEIAASAFEIPASDALPTAFRRPGREGAMGTLLADDDLAWQADLYFAEAPDEAEIRAFIADQVGPAAASALTFSTVPQQDWVAASLEGLDPVQAGRFIVHGAHDRHKIAANRIGIAIEAALAFGTGHHGTTRGCLLLFSQLLKKDRPALIADIGTGTGVLAIAAAKALNIRVHAGEIDPDSVRIARENAILNAVGRQVRPVIAAGFGHPALRGRRYALIFANILARPLKRLAKSVAAHSRPGTRLILSGLLPRDRQTILSAYGRMGFDLEAETALEGWVSLMLRRGGHAKTRRVR